MLVTFSSKNAADVLMLSHHAQPLLKAAGKDVGNPFPERGVFTAEQLESAIASFLCCRGGCFVSPTAKLTASRAMEAR